jgi:hypothetical protein
VKFLKIAGFLVSAHGPELQAHKEHNISGAAVVSIIRFWEEETYSVVPVRKS